MQQAPETPAALTVEALGLTIGSRIEVRWDVIPDDPEAEAYSKWWGASILRQADPSDSQPGPCYALAYDAEEGFDAEERAVRITGQHELVDLVDGSALHWRRQGDEWEVPEEEQESEGGEETLENLVQSLPGEDEMRAAEEEAMSDLDAATQRRIAAAFRDYADRLKEYLKAREQAAKDAGQEFVVTDSIVQEFKAAFARRPAGMPRDQGN